MKEIFPVTESTLSAHALGELITSGYGWSKQAQCVLFRTGMNHLYQVTNGEDRFVFRVYSFNWRTRMEIEEELRLVLLLHENQVDVSYAIADNTGNFIQEIQAPEGLRYGVLFSFANGKKKPRFNTKVSYNIGEAMARMHMVTHGLMLQRATYDTDSLLVKSHHSVRSFFKQESSETRFVDEVTTYLTQAYQQVNPSMLRKGVVHLDIWFDNLHVREDDSITFFDFDFCGNGWLCHDIAYFMFQLFNTNPEADEYQSKLDSFIKGYESVNAISTAEREFIPVAATSVFLFYLGVQCDRFDTWSNIFLNEDHLKRYVFLLKKWMRFQQLPGYLFLNDIEC